MVAVLVVAFGIEGGLAVVRAAVEADPFFAAEVAEPVAAGASDDVSLYEIKEKAGCNDLT